MFSKIISILTVVLCISGCTTTVEPESQWRGIVYQGFDAEVMRLENSGAVDCGYFDLSFQSQKLRNNTLEKQFNCIITAQSEGKLFKAGYTWVPLDSKLTKVFISQPFGVYIKTVDVLLDGSGADMSDQLCDEVRFDISSLDVDVINCEQVAD